MLAFNSLSKFRPGSREDGKYFNAGYKFFRLPDFPALLRAPSPMPSVKAYGVGRSFSASDRSGYAKASYNYLEVSVRKAGLIVNFGRKSLEYKRLIF